MHELIPHRLDYQVPPPAKEASAVTFLRTLGDYMLVTMVSAILAGLIFFAIVAALAACYSLN